MTDYQHRWMDGSAIDLPTGKAVCVGRNYAAHARELNNPVPSKPLLFIKPATAMVTMQAPISIPKDEGDIHHEIEIALLVGKPLCRADADECQWGIAGYGLALDLTKRDVQNELKASGHPWERAKAFDGACPLSYFVDARGISTRQNLEVSLWINGDMRQRGHTGQMLFPLFELISHMSHNFTLLPGDVILSGTPEGVAALHAGDVLDARLGNVLRVQTVIG